MYFWQITARIEIVVLARHYLGTLMMVFLPHTFRILFIISELVWLMDLIVMLQISFISIVVVQLRNCPIIIWVGLELILVLNYYLAAI